VKTVKDYIGPLQMGLLDPSDQFQLAQLLGRLLTLMETRAAMAQEIERLLQLKPLSLSPEDRSVPHG